MTPVYQDHYKEYYSGTCFLTVCPAGCEASVFYCEPPHGGRIFFDLPLGKPWQLHPCTTKDREKISREIPSCQRIDQQEQHLVFDNGSIAWIAVPLEIKQNPDGTSQHIICKKMNGETITLYFDENSTVRKDFVTDVNNSHALNTNCYVIKRPNCHYYQVVFSKRRNDGGRVKEKDTQTLTVYENQNFPRKAVGR